MKSLLNKPFLSMTDYTPEEFAYYLDLAAALKKDKKEGKEIQTLKGKNFALIFEKDSTPNCNNKLNTRRTFMQ